ncbi:hypothetical protein JZO66_09965 [Enterococcus sp. DIV0242_7C1]|uniref:Prepilin-type N-terminal cleavage/methylation domain-containing protein n=1 Tax=Candidatus Enterococcus dunnyi TaxID=1834192 RepID=A0A200J914_9ENTE|nr:MULTISPECIES: hypothetical protein [unclassified Enterococcus]MBO0470872.1 hypothetical protein [Enterococcus sp. DIV0242_7C1]OUZ33319.1 hypothetical protein A5889_002030 [Enterococcus sp. 9D6_DIV0238]
MLENEEGLTLAEVLVSVVILGTTFMLLASMLIRNQQLIELNEKKKEAQYVRDELKEWMGYRGQTQDLAGLNPYVFSIRDERHLTDQQKSRRAYLILDNSGIQMKDDGSKQIPLYGEEKIDYTGRVEAGKENIERKVDYHYSEKEAELPDRWKNSDGSIKEEAHYLGKYIGNQTNHFFVVLCKVNYKEGTKDLRKDGIELNLEIYDGKTGAFMTDTVFNWVVDY